MTSQTGLPGPGVDRVCATCGRTAEPHEYFCHRCTTRLPDPPDRLAAEARERAAVARPARGWPVLLTVLGVVAAVGALVAGVVLAVVRLDLLGPDPEPPGEVVVAYLEAAQDGDCATAVEHEDAGYRSTARCERNARVLAGTDDADLRVEDELVLDDEASVKVRITLDGVAYERCTFDLRLDDAWLIDDSVCEEPTPVP